MNTLDWVMHRIDPVDCVIRLRPVSPLGRALKPSAMALEGKTLPLVLLWYMGEGDPYPGEWALGSPHTAGGTLRSLGDIGWIASGDVVPV